MKILFINKFLYRGGGSETYMLALGAHLTALGNEVQYFGMDSDNRCVSNHADAYTAYIDFRNASLPRKLQYSLKTIYSAEARKKLRLVLEDFKPDIVHMNNINFQLTPSILYEIKKHGIPMVQTLHDVQLACPNHRFYIEATESLCTECTDGNFMHCIKNKCIHHSALQSALAAAESYIYHTKNTYNLVDKYICPSHFIADVTKNSGVDEGRMITLHNFSPFSSEKESVNKKDYAIYFGRISVEKGLKTLMEAFEKLPAATLLIAGSGPLEESLRTKALPNVQFLGFKSGDELKALIEGARFSLYPSEWYENCPMSVLESISLGTPVIASDIGGTKELIAEGKTGFTFRMGDIAALTEKIRTLYFNDTLVSEMSRHCLAEGKTHTIDRYVKRLINEYEQLL